MATGRTTDGRRILRIVNGKPTVAVEGRFVSEDELHQLIREHPEVLPSEDAGLGPLTVVASKLSLDSWEPDLLAVDPRGRLVVVEFKRGTENTDVRRVIAQMMDYGSLLWKMETALFEENCKDSIGYSGSLADHVKNNLDRIGHIGFDVTAFADTLRQELMSGHFVFMYVARDLDARTERVMGYLAETSRMWFFAVEVDCFRDPETSGIAAIVPRTRFVPAWVLEELSGAGARSNGSAELADQPPAVQTLIKLLDNYAESVGLLRGATATGRGYKLPNGLHVLGVYWASGRGLEFNLQHLRDSGANDIAEDILNRISAFVCRTVTATKWPTIALADAATRPDAVLTDCVAVFLKAALANARVPTIPHSPG